jgi:hypothetical protein
MHHEEALLGISFLARCYGHFDFLCGGKSCTSAVVALLFLVLMIVM